MDKKVDLNRIVTTFFGQTAKRGECRSIQNAFYKMNEECFKFNGRWYRINSGFLIKNIETDTWVLKDDPTLIYGLGVDTKGEIIKGYFRKSIFKNVPIDVGSIPEELMKDIKFSGRTAYALNLDVVKKLGLKEDISTGIFMLPRLASRRIAIGGNYGFVVDYSFESSGDAIKEAFYEYLKKSTGRSNYAELLGGVSFGLEFETTDGYIHPRYLVKSGLIPLRDGSISGFEYVTCPLQGTKGLDTLLRATKVLTKYTAKNISCSLHLHIGNIPVSEKFLVDYWKVCKLVEKDIFSIFPRAMSNTSSYKGHDYCNYLPNLGALSSTTARQIINWASGKDSYYETTYSGLTRKPHPNDTDNNRKWNVMQRYVWNNIVPYIFSKRGTVEFRIHTASTNPAKVINWLFICAGIVNFVKTYAPSYSDEAMKKLNLNTIMNVVYGRDREVADYLNKYIDFRRDFMNQSYESGDKVGSLEIANDLDFEFKFKGKETLVSNE